MFFIFFKNGLINLLGTTISKLYLNLSIKDPILKKKLIPNYPIGCKRILLSDNYYFIEKIQSDKSCDIVMKEMNSFNSTILNIIKECNLEEYKKSAENYLNEKDTTMNDVFNRYFSEILSRKFLFNRKKIILQQLGNVNLDSLIKYAKLFIINNTKKIEFILHGN